MALISSPGHSRELPSLVFVGKAPKSRVSRNLTKVDADVAMVEKHSLHASFVKDR